MKQSSVKLNNIQTDKIYNTLERLNRERAKQTIHNYCELGYRIVCVYVYKYSDVHNR